MNIHELRKKIKEYADAYYNEDAPLVTDEEYDALMHELRRLEAENPEAVAPDSPTQVVGGKRVLGIPVEHKVPMLSPDAGFAGEGHQPLGNHRPSGHSCECGWIRSVCEPPAERTPPRRPLRGGVSNDRETHQPVFQC